MDMNSGAIIAKQDLFLAHSARSILNIDVSPNGEIIIAWVDKTRIYVWDNYTQSEEKQNLGILALVDRLRSHLVLFLPLL